MAKESKRQKRLAAKRESEKVPVTIVTEEGSFEVDDYEQFQKEQEQGLWNQYYRWYGTSFAPYPEFEYEVIYKHHLAFDNKEFTILFYNDVDFINKTKKAASLDGEVIGIMHILVEEQFNSCLVPVIKHKNCCKDWMGQNYEINNISQMITSLVLNDSQNIINKFLPHIFVQNLKVDYMEKVSEEESYNIYSILD